METVIRSARLEIGRTVLAASALPAHAAISTQDADKAIDNPAAPAMRDPAAELAEVRREIEAELRAGLQAEAKRLIAAQREEAHRQGFAAGQAEGRAAAEKEAAQRHAQWEALAVSMGEAHEAAVRRLREDIGTLAFAALCRLVGEQAASGAAVLGAVEAVCREARVDSRAVARMHPRDTALLAPSGASVMLSSGASLDLVGDESIALGGCVVESETGQFDGTFDTQLRRLHSVLTAPTRGADR